ncbi:hypothetical protein HW555_002545, partial [Spodoptera exigua]
NIAYPKVTFDCPDFTNSKYQSKNYPVTTMKMQHSNKNHEKSLRPCKSRELRGGILYTDCFCLRRNGLQYDCRRTGCQNSPLCSYLPAPLCEPARVACLTHCANPHAEELSSQWVASGAEFK